ncbi:MAG: hypothetical protein K8R35_00325, partial [Bacteroidales bacterium]|nr:hypothetical protein [Bacteroidales bacterium]
SAIMLLVTMDLKMHIMAINDPMNYIQASLIIYLLVAMLAAKSHNFSGLYILFGLYVGRKNTLFKNSGESIVIDNQ